MTDRERMDKLSTCIQNYLNGDMKPKAGYEDNFYEGVLWIFTKLTEIYPSAN